MTNLPESTENKIFALDHTKLDYRNTNGTHEFDLRLTFSELERKDTKSRICIENNNITLFIIRVPKIENRTEAQKKCHTIAEQTFGKDAGCYERSGNLHVKKPIAGKLNGYAVSQFIDDYREFKSEIENAFTFTR